MEKLKNYILDLLAKKVPKSNIAHAIDLHICF